MYDDHDKRGEEYRPLRKIEGYELLEEDLEEPRQILWDMGRRGWLWGLVSANEEDRDKVVRRDVGQSVWSNLLREIIFKERTITWKCFHQMIPKEPWNSHFPLSLSVKVDTAVRKPRPFNVYVADNHRHTVHSIKSTFNNDWNEPGISQRGRMLARSAQRGWLTYDLPWGLRAQPGLADKVISGKSVETSSACTLHSETCVIGWDRF